jgi:ferrous iron transport protein B
MKTIVLMGNPNVGKSVVFSRLTGADATTSNYPGTTVDLSRGRSLILGEFMEVIDAPGTYSLAPINRAEEVALTVLDRADLIINVVDATNLERNLFLTLELREREKPIVVALNLSDEAKHIGIAIDAPLLEKELGIPVVPTVALSGEGMPMLIARLKDAKPISAVSTSDNEKWIRVGQITREVQTITHRHHRIMDRITEASIKPATGIPLALGIIVLSFLCIRFIGEGLVTFVLDPLFALYQPYISALGAWLGPGLFRDILVGKLFNGEIDFLGSLGILTTGLYVPFGLVFPYIIAFYAIMAILEDSGYLPRLATLFDSVFHRLGMHGHAIIPLFLGLGCNVPGALATRILETRKQRFISATLMAISVPCMAKTALIFGALGAYGVQYIFMVLVTLVLVYLTLGLILNHWVKGESPEICMEIPPYRTPVLRVVAKKTWMRLRGFVAEAIPFLFAGVFLVNILYSIGFLTWVGILGAPLTETWLGLPGEATPAILIGFLRKDLAIGMLLPLGMTPVQLVIAVTTLTMFFPCVATFAVLLRELGPRDMGIAMALMISTALVVGGIMRFILIGPWGMNG